MPHYIRRQVAGVALAVIAVLGPLMIPTVTTAKLPSNIKRCARSSPDLGECLRDAVEDALPKLQGGLPKLGVHPLDPLVIERMHLSQGQGPINIDLTFTDMVTREVLSNVKVNKVAFDFDTLTIDAVTLTPRAIATCNYTIKGRVLLLPVTGNGKSKVVLRDVTTEMRIKGKRLKKSDGKEYLDVTDVETTLTPKKMELEMENLFNGDKRLGDTMNRVLNENWQLVYNEVGPSFNQAYAQIFKRPARALFLHVPLDDIFLPK